MQRARPQKVIRVECNGLHAVVLSRFLYDCTYFGEEVKAMIEAVIGASNVETCGPSALAYRTISEVK